MAVTQSSRDGPVLVTGLHPGFAEWQPTNPAHPRLHLAVLGEARDAPLLVAHRGVPTIAPENTLAAIRAACALGIPGVEMDVRFTADGVPVLLHDRTVDRTSDGHGNVDALTLAELRALDFGNWFGPKFTGQRLPTLPEALAAVAECTFDLVQLDFKSAVPLRTDSALVLIGRAITDVGLAGRAQLAADLSTLALVGALMPGVGRLTFGGVITPQMAATLLQAGIDALGVRFDDYLASSEQLTQLQAAGVTIGVWGIPSVLGLNTLSPTPQFVTSDWPWAFRR